MEPLLVQDLSTPPLLANRPDSREPTYHPALRSLLFSEHARDRRHHRSSEAELAYPPKLEKRDEEQTRLLGPISKRRELNAKKRHRVKLLDQTLPPLEIQLVQAASAGEPAEELDLSLPLQDLDLVSESQALGHSRRRDTSSNPSPPLKRWLRRRYNQVLGKIPILSYSIDSGKFSVTRSTDTATIAPSADEADLSWWNANPYKGRRR